MIGDGYARRQELMEALSSPGGPLHVDASRATVKNPSWWSQRLALPLPGRARLLSTLSEEVIDAHQPDPTMGRGTSLVAVAVAGPPGAGKTSVVERELTALSKASTSFIAVDADVFKTRLLQEAIADGSYESWLKSPELRAAEASLGEQLAPLELASLVHEESSFLATRTQRTALAAGRNVVLDKVLGSYDSARPTFEQLAAANYEVWLIDVEVPAELSRQRTRMRWAAGVEEFRSGESHLGGRWVPSAVTGPLFPPELGGRSRSQQVAERLAQEFSNVTVFKRYYTSLDVDEQARRAGQFAQPVIEKDERRPSVGAGLSPAPQSDHDRAARDRISRHAAAGRARPPQRSPAPRQESSGRSHERT